MVLKCVLIYFYVNFSEYAQVTKMLGNGRLEAMCFDGVKRLCHIRGKLRKKVFKKFYTLSSEGTAERSLRPHFPFQATKMF